MSKISEYLIEQEKYNTMLNKCLELEKTTPEIIKVHNIGSLFTVSNKLTQCKTEYSVIYNKYNLPKFTKKELEC